MYIKQKNLLAGMDKAFVKELMAQTEKKQYEAGEIVYREGQHSSRFYVLVKGCVKQVYGRDGNLVFTLNHAGEAFGWSSLLGRSTYAATAVCTDPTTLVQIDRMKFNRILEGDPVNGLLLVRRLGELLGERLDRTYQWMAAAQALDGAAVSDGTGQTMEMVAPA